MVRDCDGTATSAYCSIAPGGFLPGMTALYRYVVVGADVGPVQRLAKM